jgi:hypothetical protein
MVRDWQALAVRFKKEHARTGISVKDWCEVQGLNLASARRHIRITSAKIKVQNNKPKACKPKIGKSLQNRTVQEDENIENQMVVDSKINTNTNNDELDNVQNQKRHTQFSKGNQCARTFGHYTEFVSTDEDIERYSSSQNASLRDELHLTRMQHSNLLVEVKRIEHDLNHPATTPEIRASLYQSYAKFCSIAERKVARIESLENTLIVHEKYRIDMDKSKALTRKATLEADKLARESGSNENPLQEIYNEILKMGSDGMMNT